MTKTQHRPGIHQIPRQKGTAMTDYAALLDEIGVDDFIATAHYEARASAVEAANEQVTDLDISGAPIPGELFNALIALNLIAAEVRA
jgi:hypothetical protein